MCLIHVMDFSTKFRIKVFWMDSLTWSLLALCNAMTSARWLSIQQFPRDHGLLELRQWGSWKPRTSHRASPLLTVLHIAISHEWSPYKHKHPIFYSNTPLHPSTQRCELKFNLRAVNSVEWVSPGWLICTRGDAFLPIMELDPLPFSWTPLALASWPEGTLSGFLPESELPK